MVRISGIDLPSEKRLDISLTYLYGIGRSNVIGILEKAKLDPTRRMKTLTDDEVSKLTKLIEKEAVVEGDLRRTIGESIKRLIEIKSYRGLRHSKRLPLRGQRTRTNARTRRGKRMTVGALKKEDRAKLDTPTKPTEGKA
ncbi:MAG: 30S ribosomal protein S13 [Patescibacteria group bacterium]